MLSLLPHDAPTPLVDIDPGRRRPGLAAGREGGTAAATAPATATRLPPYIRRTKDNRLLVTVAEPVERDKHTVGIIC